jgi:hypothetical protein
LACTSGDRHCPPSLISVTIGKVKIIWVSLAVSRSSPFKRNA